MRKQISNWVGNHKRALATIGATLAFGANKAFAVATADTAITAKAEDFGATSAALVVVALVITVSWMGVRILRRVK